MVVELKPHQVTAVEKMHDGCVLTGGVGTGKTVTALAYYYTKVLGGTINDTHSITHPVDLYIFTTARKRDEFDWQTWGMRFGIGTDREISAGGVTITVDSYNNIDKYRDVQGAFIIYDEQRMVGSGAWTKVFLRQALHNRWVMLSATPGDNWLDYIPLFVANGFYKNRTHFKREHCVYSHYGKFPKLEKYLNVNKLVKLQNSIIVEMPFERHTKRHIVTHPVEYDKELFDKAVKTRWNPFEQRPQKDAAELFSVMRKIVNSDSSRAIALRDLMQKHPKLIVFYNFDYELQILRTLVNEAQEIPSSNEDLLNNNSLPSIQAFPISGREPVSRLHDSIQTSLSGSSTTSIPSGASCLPANVETDIPSLTPSSTNTYTTTDGSTPASGTRKKASTGPVSLKDWHKQLETRMKMSSATGPSMQLQGSTGQRPKSSRLPDESTTRKISMESGERTKTSSPSPLDSNERDIHTTKSSMPSSSRKTPKYEIAEWNGKKHEPVPSGDHWVYLVQYLAGAEAWDCTETDAIAFYSLTYSYKIFEQAQGRIDRLNTPFVDLYYYVLTSKSPIDRVISKALRNKKSFNEKDYSVYKSA